MDLPQPSVAIDVDFFDERARKELLQYPTAAKILQVANRTIHVPTSEFLTYYLFRRKRPGMPNWASYRAIGDQVDRALIHLKDFVNFNGHSIYVSEEVGVADSHVTEYLGEAVALSVANRIHDLTEADWDRIPASTRRRTFDYRHTVSASDSFHIVQVEAKGTVVKDSARHWPTTRKHRHKIEEKKIQISQQEAAQAYPYPADVRYGSIGSIGTSVEGSIRCWLVDPEAEGDGSNARRFRLLARMRGCFEIG